MPRRKKVVGSNPTTPEEPVIPEKVQPDEPQPPQEPSQPTTLEEAKKEITVEDRIANIEKQLAEFPLALKQYDEGVQKREEANHHKLLDDIIAAVSKKGAITPTEAASSPSTAQPQKDGGWGWVKDILENPLLKSFMGSSESPELALGVDFKDIFNEMQRQAILKLKNDYRKTLGLPFLPDTTHVQDAGH